MSFFFWKTRKFPESSVLFSIRQRVNHEFVGATQTNDRCTCCVYSKFMRIRICYSQYIQYDRSCLCIWNLRQSQDSDYLRFLEIAPLIFPQHLILGINNYYHYVEKNCAITIVSIPTLHDVGYRLWERIFVYIYFRKLTFYMENSRDDPYRGEENRLAHFFFIFALKVLLFDVLSRTWSYKIE